MSSIYINRSYWGKLTFSKLRFSEPKKLVSRIVFGELHLMQISLHFKTFCYNLKIRGLVAKACFGFLLFQFWKELWSFKVKNSMYFFEKKNFNKNEIKNGKSHTRLVEGCERKKRILSNVYFALRKFCSVSFLSKCTERWIQKTSSRGVLGKRCSENI